MPIIHNIGALLTYMDVVDDCIKMYCPSCLLSVVLETARFVAGNICCCNKPTAN